MASESVCHIQNLKRVRRADTLDTCPKSQHSVPKIEFQTLKYVHQPVASRALLSKRALERQFSMMALYPSKPR